MAVPLQIEKKTLHFTEDKKQVYVAKANRGNVIDTDKIAEFVAQDTGARVAQVRLVLTSLIDSMISWIEEGHGVQLGNLGSFHPSVKSVSSENPDEVAVKRVKLTFYPSKKLRERVNAVSYTTENPYDTETEEDTSTGDSGSGGTEME